MKIDDKYKWLARDKNGKLFAFENKPKKMRILWSDKKMPEIIIEETDERFAFIRWEDECAVRISNIGNIIAIDSNDIISKPSHYIGINGLEVETVLQNFIPKYKDGYVAHRASSAIEYLLRSPEKNGLEDIKKAKQNLEQIIEYEEAKEQTIEKELKVSNFKMSCAVNSPFVSDNLMEFLNSLSNIPNEITNYHAGTNPLD